MCFPGKLSLYLLHRKVMSLLVQRQKQEDQSNLPLRQDTFGCLVCKKLRYLFLEMQAVRPYPYQFMFSKHLLLSGAEPVKLAGGEN